MNIDSKVYYINNTDDHPFTWLKNLPVYIKDNMKYGVGYVECVSITTNLHDIEKRRGELVANFQSTAMVDVKFPNGQRIRTTVDNLIHEDKLPEMAKLLYT